MTDLEAVTALLATLGGEETIEEYSDNAARLAALTRELVAEVEQLRALVPPTADRPATSDERS